MATKKTPRTRKFSALAKKAQYAILGCKAEPQTRPAAELAAEYGTTIEEIEAAWRERDARWAKSEQMIAATMADMARDMQLNVTPAPSKPMTREESELLAEDFGDYSHCY